MQAKAKYVHVIVNPAPSRRIPLLALMNGHFREAGIHWDLSITHGTGDGAGLARKAIEGGADVVGVYGGDGTVMEVASALVGTNVPLLILPGGTGNLVAAELGIGRNLDRACRRVCGETYESRAVDVGKMGDRHFLLRVGAGFETGVVQDATRELKDQFGKWAYVFAGIRRLQENPAAEYEIVLDDKEIFRGTGIACGVANSGTVGWGKLALSPAVDLDDGLLDVFFLKKVNLESVMRMVGTMIGLDPPQTLDQIPGLKGTDLVKHWQARKVDIRSDPPMDIQVDGDVIAQTPQSIEVLPGALHVVV